MDLQEIRRDIDYIDQQLVDLFCRRMALSAQVADYKKANNLPVFFPEREQEILNRVSEQAGPELAPYIRRLYAALFDESCLYQAEVMK